MHHPSEPEHTQAHHKMKERREVGSGIELPPLPDISTTEVGHHKALAPTLALLLKIAAPLGFCPIHPKTLKRRIWVMVIGVVVLVVQVVLMVDLFISLFLKAGGAVFAFSTHVIVGILHFAIALQGVLSCLSNLWGLEKWRTLISLFATTKEETAEFRLLLWRRIKRGFGFTLFGLFVYLCAVGLSIMSAKSAAQRLVLGFQQGLAAVSIGFYSFLTQMFGAQLQLHSEKLNRALHKTLEKIDERNTLRHEPAVELSRRYLGLRKELESLDKVIRWPAFIALFGWFITGTFASYSFLVRKNKFDYDMLHMLSLVIIQQGSTLVLFISAYHVNEKSRLVKEILLTTPRSLYSRDAKQHMVMMSRVAEDKDWSLTAGSVFRLDAGLILTTLGIIMSHVMLLYEIGSYDDEQKVADELASSVIDNYERRFNSTLNKLGLGSV